MSSRDLPLGLGFLTRERQCCALDWIIVGKQQSSITSSLHRWNIPWIIIIIIFFITIDKIRRGCANHWLQCGEISSFKVSVWITFMQHPLYHSFVCPLQDIIYSIWHVWTRKIQELMGAVLSRDWSCHICYWQQWKAETRSGQGRTTCTPWE